MQLAGNGWQGTRALGIHGELINSSAEWAYNEGMTTLTATYTRIEVYARMNWLSHVAAALVICLLIAAVVRERPAPLYDQGALLSYGFEQGVPAFRGAMSSSLFAGIANTVHPNNAANADRLLRGMSAALYLGVGYLLSRRLPYSWLTFALIASSRFAFIMVSSEPIAGAFLMLFLWTYLSKQSFKIQMIPLAVFALARPDTLPIGVFIGAYVASQQTKRLPATAWLIALIGVPALLGIVAAPASAGSRELLSFSQHYAVLVAPHQRGLAPEPWLYSDAYIAPVFDNVQTLPQVIASNPAAYMDFVFLSLAHSIRQLLPTYLLLIGLVAAVTVKRAWRARRDLLIIVALLMLNLVPILLMSFLHIRYQARFYPVVLAVAVVGVAQMPRRLRRPLLFALVCILLMQALELVGIILQGGWLTD